MSKIPQGYDDDLDDDQSAFYQDMAEAGRDTERNFHSPSDPLPYDVLKTRLRLTAETLMECERRRKIAEKKARQWDKLRTWLSNLVGLESTMKTDKKGLQIALNIMDRIEEDTI